MDKDNLRPESSKQLLDLQRIILDSQVLSELLPEITQKSLDKDEKLSNVLIPVVESGFEKSFSRNQKKMVDTLFPVIGECVKRYVNESLKNLVQSMSAIIDRALSIEGLKWRLESYRTGLTLGEVALRHTLLYRVEHLFLISKNQGSTLAHLKHPEGVEADQATFAGMVGTLSDFVKDVFLTLDQNTVQQIDFGNHHIQIFEGRWSRLVVVCRGILPTTVKDFFESQINELSQKDQSEYSPEQLMQILEGGLFEQNKVVRQEKSKGPWILSFFGITMAVIAMYFVAGIITESFRGRRFEQFLSKIRQSSQYILLEASRKKNKIEMTVIASDTSSTKENILNLSRKLKISDQDLNLNIIDSSQYLTRISDDETREMDHLLKSINGIEMTEGNSRINLPNVHRAADLIANTYLRAKKFNLEFLVLIEYKSPELKRKADSLSGLMRGLLEKNDIFGYHFIRTKLNPRINEITLNSQMEKHL